jgi:phage-related protein
LGYCPVSSRIFATNPASGTADPNWGRRNDRVSNLKDARQDAGYQIDKVQQGEQPDDFKPMPAIGKCVEEIRIWDESGTYRIVYTARLADAVIVLHAFQKKTQTTSKRDIDLAKERFTEFMKGQK